MGTTFLLTRPSRDVTDNRFIDAAYHAFLLTRPSRDVTNVVFRIDVFRLFLLTRPSRDVTISHRQGTAGIAISTHTSLAGRDKGGDAV